MNLGYSARISDSGVLAEETFLIPIALLVVSQRLHRFTHLLLQSIALIGIDNNCVTAVIFSLDHPSRSSESKSTNGSWA